jgi:hypothetical protein
MGVEEGDTCAGAGVQSVAQPVQRLVTGKVGEAQAKKWDGPQRGLGAVAFGGEVQGAEAGKPSSPLPTLAVAGGVGASFFLFSRWGSHGYAPPCCRKY